MQRSVRFLGSLGLVMCTVTLVACGGDSGGSGGTAGATGGTAGTTADGGNQNAGASANGDAAVAGSGTSGSGAAGTTAADGGALDGGAGTSGGDADVGDATVTADADVDAGPDASIDAGPALGVTMAAKVSCKDHCDLQETLVGTGGSCPSVSLVADCKTECTTSANASLTDCSDEFKAYYDCSATDGYRCLLGKVAQKTTACADEKATLDTCNGM